MKIVLQQPTTEREKERRINLAHVRLEVGKQKCSNMQELQSSKRKKNKFKKEDSILQEEVN